MLRRVALVSVVPSSPILVTLMEMLSSSEMFVLFLMSITEPCHSLGGGVV
jgi:hypothetical protein